jgi:hypothetical protein
LLPQFAATKSGFAAVVALLMTVWAINFFVVLPVVNPGFVTVVPLAISFISKTLFGIAAAIMLVRR